MILNYYKGLKKTGLRYCVVSLKVSKLFTLVFQLDVSLVFIKVEQSNMFVCGI